MFKRLKVWWNTRRLDSDSADVRRAAAEALGKLGDARAVQPLIRALGDGEPEVRSAAGQALFSLHEPKWRGIVKGQDEDFARLGGCGDARAAEPLLQALRDPKSYVLESDVRRRAAEALGKLADRRAVQPLIRALAEKDSSVRRAAAEALGELPDRSAVEPLIWALGDGDQCVRRAAADTLTKLGQAAVEPLIRVLVIRALGGWRRSVRQVAAVTLGELRDPRAVGPLIRALGDGEPDVRHAAAEGLGKLGDARAVEPLITALRDSYLRKAARDALTKLGQAAVEPLIRALGDGEADVRRAVVETLAKLADLRAVEPLIRTLGDGESEIRRAVVETLAKLADPRAVEPLIEALGDGESGVRRAAARALGKLADRRAAPRLIRALDEPDRFIRCAAVEVLGKLGDRCAVEPLLRALGDMDDEVRRTAAEALEGLGEPTWQGVVNGGWDDFRRLGTCGDQRPLELLIRALGEGESPHVREAAAKAVARVADPRTVEPLIRALGDSHPEVGYAAAEGLGRLGDARAVEPLIRALTDSYLRKAAADALTKLGQAAVEPLIRALGESRSSLREGAAATLGQLRDPRAVEPLIRALGDGESEVRRAAVETLAELADPRAVEPLIRALGDGESEVRRAAVETLAKLADPRAVEPLIRALGDGESEVRRAASDALRKLGTVLFDRFVSSSGASEIFSAAHQIARHFTSTSCEYPADEVGEVLLDLISPKSRVTLPPGVVDMTGGRGTTFHWLALVMIVDTGNPYYFEYLTPLTRFIERGMAPREWTHTILKELHTRIPHVRPDWFRELIELTAGRD